jgi:hypothetical protein
MRGRGARSQGVACPHAHKVAKSRLLIPPVTHVGYVPSEADVALINGLDWNVATQRMTPDASLAAEVVAHPAKIETSSWTTCCTARQTETPASA